MSSDRPLIPEGTRNSDLFLSREGGPTIFAQVKNGKNVDHIVNLILSAWKASGAAQAQKA